jgi:mRNA-degrading endonuclease toxin of MazEF toxin-antitoxin module
MSPQRGEVWLADLGIAGKIRPVIIISRDDPDPPRKITTYIPITSENRGSNYEVELPPLPFLTLGSTANTQGVTVLRQQLKEIDSFEESGICLLMRLAKLNRRCCLPLVSQTDSPH